VQIYECIDTKIYRYIDIDRYMYVCMYACMYVYTYTYTYICLSHSFCEKGGADL